VTKKRKILVEMSVKIDQKEHFERL